MNRAELGRPTRTGPRAGSGFSRSVIESIGVELPERIVSTAEIQRGCERPIALRLDRLTGVRHRRVAGDGVFSIDLAKRAIARCLALSRYEPGDIDLLVCCNMSRYDGPGFHYTFEPNTSIRLRSHFGFESAIAFDVGNACAGMFTALKLVDALLRAEAIDVAMVVSGEYITHLTATAQKELADLDDPRLACLTLGDAGVALMVDRAADDRSGFHAIELYTAGRYSHLGIAKPTDRSHGGAIMLTNSLKLHKVAIRHSAENIARTLERVGWGRSDLDHVICHQTHEAAFYEAARQVNERVEDEFCHDDNMVRNVAERGNTASTTPFSRGLGRHPQRSN